MNYNDFSILSDNEYLKIAEQYNKEIHTSSISEINNTYELLENCKHSLQFSDSFKNYKIKNELKNHFQVLLKLSNNLKYTFSINKSISNNFKEFNLFNYLTNLIEIQSALNNYLKLENNSKNKLLIINIKNEINNLIISLLNLLSQTNILFFKFM